MPEPSLQSDSCFQAWLTGQGLPLIPSPFYGPYANNANYAFRIAKSRPDLKLPDLFIAGQATQFDGFFPGYSQMTLGQTWTWLILKVHTKNTAGVVTLRSTDPRRMPEINFHYFEEGNNGTDPNDLNAAVEGVKLARSYVKDPQAAQHVAAESTLEARFRLTKTSQPTSETRRGDTMLRVQRRSAPIVIRWRS